MSKDILNTKYCEVPGPSNEDGQIIEIDCGYTLFRELQGVKESMIELFELLWS